MKDMKKTLFILTAIAALVSGCKSTKVLLPSVSGKAGEVIVVMEKADWEGSLGEATRGLLAAEVPYFIQQEPLYTLVNVTPSAFGDLFKVHRNIVMFSVDPQVDSTGVIYRQDVWSSPQCVIQICAYDSDGAEQILAERGDRIVTAIEQAERNRVIRNSIRYEEKKATAAVMKVFGGSPRIPTGYKIRKITDDFAWIANDTQTAYKDILIYRYPVTEEDPFTREHIIAHRNEIMMENVPGMFDNTYMTTGEAFEPMCQTLRYQGRYFVETRGWWEVKGDYMGGPFVSHSFYNRDGSEIYVAEAFVYAPAYDKRQYLRQAESILYSWEWADEDKEEETK